MAFISEYVKEEQVVYSNAKKLEGVSNIGDSHKENNPSGNNANEEIDSYEDSNEYWDDYFMRKGRNRKTYRDKYSEQEHDRDDW